MNALSDLSSPHATPSERADEPGSPTPCRMLTVVVPAMNEAPSLRELHERILAVTGSIGLRCQVVFVDDGSTDETWSVMEGLARQHADTIALRFRRNFGKAAALSAGFRLARGEIVITMDADLQDDPKEIPRFLEMLQGPVDVVSGWKQVRHDPWHKVWPSRVFNSLVSRMTGVHLHDHNCGFKAYRRDVLRRLDLYGERHRFVPVLADAMGWRVGELSVEHHPRLHGHSKYGVSRMLKGFLDLMSIYLLTGYGRRPLHLIGSVGFGCFGLGVLGMLYLSFMWVWTRLGDGVPLHLHATAIFYYCILATLLGAQFLLAGLLAELVVSQAAARHRDQRDLVDRLLASDPDHGLLRFDTNDYSVADVARSPADAEADPETPRDANG